MGQSYSHPRYKISLREWARRISPAQIGGIIKTRFTNTHQSSLTHQRSRRNGFYSFLTMDSKSMGQHRVSLMQKTKTVIHPKTIPSWRFVLCAVMLYSSLVVPFEIAELPLTYLSPGRIPIFILNRAMDIIMLMDFILNFFLAVYDRQNNLWISNQTFIIAKYLREWFLVDAISTFPYDLVSLALPLPEGRDGTTYKVLSFLAMLRLLRLTRLVRVEHMFSTMRNEVNWDYSQATLTSYGIYAVLIIHWMACSWWYVGELEWLLFDDIDTWMVAFFKNYPLVQNHDKYIAACYWSVMTASTIGYASHAQTVFELCFMCVLMLTSAFCFGYIVGTVAAIMATRGLQKHLMYQIMDDIAHFCTACHIPQKLRHKLEQYFEFRCTQALDHDYHLLLLHDMSPALRQEVSIHTDAQWLSRLHIFAEAPGAMVAKLAIAMEQTLYPPTEMIFHKGDQVKSLYVIKRGIVVSGGIIRCQGHALGAEALLASHQSTCSARAMTYCEVNEIGVDAMYAIMDGFPRFKQRIRTLAARKVFKHEILAYAEAFRRVADMRQELRLMKLSTLQPSKFLIKSKTPSRAEGEEEEEEEEDVSMSLSGATINIDYLVKCLKDSLPDSEVRVAHYMCRLARHMALMDKANAEVVRAAVTVQRAWRRIKRRLNMQRKLYCQHVLTWATFMLKIAAEEEDPVSQALWTDVAQTHLARMGIRSEDDVRQALKSLNESGLNVNSEAIMAGIESRSKWQKARAIVPAMRLGARVLDFEKVKATGDPMMGILLAVVRWKSENRPSAAVQKEAVNSAEPRQKRLTQKARLERFSAGVPILQHRLAEANADRGSLSQSGSMMSITDGVKHQAWRDTRGPADLKFAGGGAAPAAATNKYRGSRLSAVEAAKGARMMGGKRGAGFG